MISYGALLIPVIAAFILWKYFSHKTVWWEFCIPLFVSLIMIFSMKCIIEAVQVSSKEYWGSLVSRVEYYEEWNEWITKTCTRECCCDSKGQNCEEESYDCSYCQTHPAQWLLITTTGESVAIDQEEYIKIKHTFGNETFTELNRNYYTKDGNEYSCTWKRDSLNAVPVTTTHTYENRVKAAPQSV